MCKCTHIPVTTVNHEVSFGAGTRNVYQCKVVTLGEEMGEITLDRIRSVSEAIACSPTVTIIQVHQ